MICWSFVILLLLGLHVNMDEIHDTANKLFDDAPKKKKKVTKNVNKDSTKISTGEIANLPYKCCIYCQKVFYNSKFLMKHLLRRHSDELILVYKTFTDREFNNRDLVDILKKEFSSLKEFVSAKIAIDGKRKIEEDQSTEGKEAIHTTEKNQNSSCDIVPNESRDSKEEMLDVKKDIQNLKDKFLSLDSVLKNEVLLKQDLNDILALSEGKIMKFQEQKFIELRDFILSELESWQHNQQENITKECKSQLSELKSEVRKLKTTNANQLICTESLKEEIKKELMPHIIPHVCNRKCERKQLKYSLSKSELSVSKSHLSPPQMSSHENSTCKESNSKRFKRHSEANFKDNFGLTSLVTEKLSQFSIAPNITKVSDADFYNKEKLLTIEKERLSKKYCSFNKIYDKLNMIADQKARSKLKNKKHYKIKFADSLTSCRNNSNHSSPEDGSHKSSLTLENRKKQFNSTKMLMPSDSRCVFQNEALSAQESTNLAFHDKGASGDSVPFSNKQSIPMKRTKLSSIKEYEASDSIEDVQNSENLAVTSTKESITFVAEQSKYKKQSDSISPLPIEKKNLNPSVNSHFVEFEHSTPNKGDSGDSAHLFLNKQNMPMKRAKSSSFKKFETSSPFEDSRNTKNLKVRKDNTTVTAEQSKFERQSSCVSPAENRKLISVLNGNSAQIKEVPKTSDKLTELEDYSKSDEDFDDVSSLEPLSLNNDDHY